jgi:hypothetical protein
MKWDQFEDFGHIWPEDISILIYRMSQNYQKRLSFI